MYGEKERKEDDAKGIIKPAAEKTKEIRKKLKKSKQRKKSFESRIWIREVQVIELLCQERTEEILLFHNLKIT